MAWFACKSGKECSCARFNTTGFTGLFIYQITMIHNVVDYIWLSPALSVVAGRTCKLRAHTRPFDQRRLIFSEKKLAVFNEGQSGGI